MATLIVFWVIAAALLGLLAFAFVRLFQRKQLTPYDVLAIPLPFIVWWLLASSGWNPKSLGNLVEPLILALLIPICLNARTFLTGYRSNQFRSVSAFAICLLLSGVLYAFVPILPE